MRALARCKNHTLDNFFIEKINVIIVKEFVTVHHVQQINEFCAAISTACSAT